MFVGKCEERPGPSRIVMECDPMLLYRVQREILWCQMSELRLSLLATTFLTIFSRLCALCLYLLRPGLTYYHPYLRLDILKLSSLICPIATTVELFILLYP